MGNTGQDAEIAKSMRKILKRNVNTDVLLDHMLLIFATFPKRQRLISQFLFSPARRTFDSRYILCIRELLKILKQKKCFSLQS